MTGILDLMHASSYAWKAAKAQGDATADERYASWILQGGGDVKQVIAELSSCQQTLNSVPGDQPVSDDSLERAITYFTNHQDWMHDPKYRQQGLPLTSSHIELTINLINIRMKGSEKFFRQDNGETLLQLRADSLCESHPLLDDFRPRWLRNQTRANTYRKQTT